MTALIFECGEQHAGPKTRSVFTYEPALFFELTLGVRDLKDTLRNPICNGFGRIEARVMAPDDLFGCIALNALCTVIPTHDMTRGIEHDDGVFGDAADQQLKAFLKPLAFGKVDNRTERVGAIIHFDRA